MGERGRGGCHIQITESTLLEKVTVWVKWGGGGCHIQIPESTLLEKVTVWVKWGGGGCHIQIPESTLVEKVTVWVKWGGLASPESTLVETAVRHHADERDERDGLFPEDTGQEDSCQH